ncbi:MAG: GxxExxY protein [Fimbriimonadaceae bacterium]|nr:GxxExxY protein [Chthonomonadaceae bacterium]MCO5296171.1 GxxExxY protein [Fimbriimonadaceae bacterium]
MTENEISRVVFGAALGVHRALGPGLLESVYESALAYELGREGLSVKRQQAIAAVYDGLPLGLGFRTDLVIEEKVIVEIKSVEEVPHVAFKVVLTYLRLADMRLGLLINFGETQLRNGFRRIANKLVENAP